MEKIEKTVDKLSSFYTKGCCFPECTYMFGMKSTGKSLSIKKFLDQSEWINFVIVSAKDCYTSKILFDSIVNKFNNHELSSLNGYENYAKIDNIEDFLTELANLDRLKSYLIIVENAENMRDMDANILPVFMRLQEFTNLNISCLLVSHLPIEKFGVHNIPKIYVPNYSKNEIIDILASKYSTIYDEIRESINDEEKLKLVELLDEGFYRQFLNIFMNVSFKTCRDLTELEPLAIKCYTSYYTPVLSGEIQHNDVTNLWRNISHILRASINSSQMRIKNVTMKDLGKENESNFDPSQENQKNLRSFAQNLELPFYAKYLLIASFLASHNDAKFDKRLFMKNHGKERKRAHKPTASEKMNTQFGPKSFTIDRLLAIFYAILDEKIGLTCNLLAQISTLVDLNFLNFVSGEANIMDGNAKLQSTIGLDFAINIGKVVGFNVKQYLTDFY